MNRNIKLTDVSIIGVNDDWYVDCSDDEKYNPTHQPLGTWEPAPDDIVDLFEKLQKNKVLELHWKCPGRLPPESENREEENPKYMEMEQEKEEEAKPLQPTEFDFDDDTSEPTTKITPRKTPGSVPKTPKRVARMDKVLQDIMTQRKLNAAEREARKANKSRAGQSPRGGRIRSPGSSQQAQPANKSTPVRPPFREANSKAMEENILDFSFSSASAEPSRVPGTNTQGVQTPGRIPSIGPYTKFSTINRSLGLNASAPPGRTISHTPVGQMNQGLAGIASSRSTGVVSTNDISNPDYDAQSKSGNVIAHASANVVKKSTGECVSSSDTHSVLTDPSKVEAKSVMCSASASPGKHIKISGSSHFVEMSETNWIPDFCPTESIDDVKAPATVSGESESSASIKTTLPATSTVSTQSFASVSASSVSSITRALANTPHRIPKTTAMVGTPSRVSSGSMVPCTPGRIPSNSSARLGTPSRVPKTNFTPKHVLSTPGRVPRSSNASLPPTPSRVPVLSALSNTPRHASMPQRVLVSDEMTFTSQPNRIPVTSSISERAVASLGSEDVSSVSSYTLGSPFGTTTDKNSQSIIKANSSTDPLQQTVSQNQASNLLYAKPESVNQTLEMGETEAQEKKCLS